MESKTPILDKVLEVQLRFYILNSKEPLISKSELLSKVVTALDTSLLPSFLQHYYTLIYPSTKGIQVERVTLKHTRRSYPRDDQYTLRFHINTESKTMLTYTDLDTEGYGKNWVLSRKLV